MTMSRTHRLLHVIAAFLVIALMGGAVYGWPSMRPILRREGFLRASSCDKVPVDEPCDEQELSLGLVFTVGSWSNQGGRLFVGIILDRIGPRWTSFACALVCGVGSVVFAMASTTLGLSAGYLCIGVGGAGMQLALQSVSALFPRNKGLVMAMLSGAFQAASSIFLLFETIHRLADVSLRALMLGYAVALLIAALVCLVIWPNQPFGVNASNAAKDSSDQPGDGNSPAKTANVQTNLKKTTEKLPLDKRSFREQVLSPEYVLMTTFFTFTVLQAQFTIGTIGTQFELKGDNGDLRRVFNLVFSLSWTITPLVGMMIDRLGYSCVMILMNTVMIGSTACLLAPWQGLQYATAVLYTLGRVSIWAAFFSFNGSLFGFRNYGKLVGGGLFVASSCSLLQYPLLMLTIDVFGDEFAYVNAMFIAMAVLMYPVIFRLHCLLRKPKSAGITEIVGMTGIVVHDAPVGVESTMASPEATTVTETGTSSNAC